MQKELSREDGRYLLISQNSASYAAYHYVLTIFLGNFIIQEDLLKINKNILNYYSYLQVHGEIRTQKEKEKKNTSRCSLHYITQTKNKQTKKKRKKTSHTNMYKINMKDFIEII